MVIVFPVLLFINIGIISQAAGKRVKAIRELIRDVAGYAPYERRIMELCRNGLDKRALKLAKKKVFDLRFLARAG